MQQYYISNLEIGFCELNSEETKHLNVLRKRIGDIVRLTNGNGLYTDAIISKIDKNSTILEIEKIIEVEQSKPTLTLAVSPLKNAERYEWMLEKCTEIGVNIFIPLVCRRSESPLRKIDRLERIIISAAMQSKRFYIPKLLPATPFAEVCKMPDYENKLIPFCEEETGNNINKHIIPNKKTIILIGPEGDFTKEEYDFATSQGFTSVSLGNNILRTETAGIFASTAFKIFNL